MTTHALDYATRRTKTGSPSDPDFFGDTSDKSKRRVARLPKLREIYSDDLDAFYDLFVARCDWRAYNTKRGYWDSGDFDVQAQDWRPKRKRFTQEGKLPYIPATKGSILDDLERHLDTQYWRERGHRAKGWRQPFFVGTLGGQTSAAFHYDLDNHGGQRIDYTKDGGNFRVPDLSLGFLRLVQRVLALPFEEYGLRPTNLTTSSDSLGLYIWFIPDIPMLTSDGHAKLRSLADAHGLDKLEAYPIPARMHAGPYDGRSVSRLPCGQGAVSLTADGMIRGWREQVLNFIEPKPLPGVAKIVEQLLGLWLELHEAWMPGFLKRPTPRREHYEQRVAEILAWLSGGSPQTDASEAEAHTAGMDVKRAGKKSMSGCTGVVLPEGWDRKPYPDRLYHIATRGCPAAGMLNTCLIMLARHLMTYELDDLGDGEKEEVAYMVCERWALGKHNGCSGRLSEGDEVLPKDVASVIWRDISSVPFRELPEGEKNTLRVRHLVTGEGRPNVFIPRANPGEGDVDLLSVYTSANFHNQDNDYQQALGRIIEAIRSGTYDHETIAQVEERIVLARPAFRLFARRLTNYLLTRPNQTARVHTDTFMAMADSSSPTTATKYKRVAREEKIIKVVSHNFRVGGQSKLYQLHPSLGWASTSRAGGPAG